MTNFLLILSLLFMSCSPRTQNTTKVKAPVDSVAVAEDCRARAGQFYEADHLDSALVLFTRATQFNPHSPAAWHGRASTLSRLKRHAEAQAAYDEAIRLKPDYVTAIWHRGCDFAVQLDKERALADLRHAVALDSAVKQDAKQDPCFDWLWDDKDFMAIVK